MNSAYLIAPLLRWSSRAAAVLLLGAMAALPAHASESARAALDIRLRAEPTLQSPVVRIVRKGEILTVLETEGEFSRLRTVQGQEGYFRTKYLERAQSVAPAVAVLAPDAVPPASAPAAQPAPASEPTAPDAAPNAAPAPRARSPWTLSAVTGMSLSFINAGDLQAAFQSSGINATVTDIDESAGLVGLRAAYALTDRIALEAGVLTLGEYEAEVNIPGANTQQVHDVLQREYPASGPGVTLAALFTTRYGSWTLSGRTGAFVGLGSNVDVVVGGLTSSTRLSQNSWLLGGGVSYQILPNWDLGLELNATDLNGAMLGGGLTLGVRL